MKVVVIGSGGWEYILVWLLVRLLEVSYCYCLLGNGGIVGLLKIENVAIVVD